MKKVDVKALFSKRLIPLLIVPTLLGSNFISIQAFADGQESIVDAVETEQSEQQEPVSEEPVVEETPVTEEQTVEEQEETAQDTETAGGDTTEDQQANPENSTTENTTETEEAVASDEASTETSEAVEEEIKEQSEKEETEKEVQKEKKETELTENKVVVSVEDFTFPVELVVEGAADENDVDVYAVSDDGTSQQLSEGEAVDVKVDGVEVVTTQTTTVATEDGDDEADGLELVSKVVSTKSKVDMNLSVEPESDESTEDTSSDEANAEESVEIVKKVNETPQVSFEYSLDKQYEIESASFNGEDVEFADGYITITNLDEFLSLDNDDAEAYTLGIRLSKVEDKVEPTIGEISVTDKELDNQVIEAVDGVYVGNKVVVNIPVKDNITKKDKITVTAEVPDDTKTFEARYVGEGDDEQGIYALTFETPGEYTIKKIIAKDSSNNTKELTQEIKIRVNKKPVIGDITPIGEYDPDCDEYVGSEVGLIISAEDDCTDASQLNIVVEYTKDNETQRQSAVASYSEGKFRWLPAEKGYFKIVNIIARDTNNGVSNKPSTFAFYKNDAVVDESLVSVELDSYSGNNWFSFEKNKEGLSVRVSGNADRKVAGISLNNGNFVELTRWDNHGSRWFGYSYSKKINIPSLDDGEYESLTVTIKFNNGQSITRTVNCKNKILIDSTKPLTDGIIVEAKNADASEYVQLTKDTNPQFSTNQEVNFRIRVPADAADISKLGKVSVVISELTLEDSNRVNVHKDHLIEWNCEKWTEQDGYYVTNPITMLKKENTARTFVLNSISLCDNAQNDADSKAFEGCNVVIDLAKPFIDYDPVSNAEKSFLGYNYEDKVINFYDGDVTENIKVSDYDIAEDGVVISLTSENGTSILTEAKEGKTPIKAVPVPDEVKVKDNIIFKRNKELSYTYTLSAEGEYQFNTDATDVSGNNNQKDSETIVIDKTAPVVKIILSCGTAEGKDTTFSAKNVDITAVVTEKWFNPEKSTFVINAVDENGAAVTVPISSGSEGNIWEFDTSLNAYVAKTTTPVDGIYSVKVDAYDLVGNHGEAETKEFTVDTKAPEINITFDNNDVKNGKYYNKQRVATISVKDFTFNADKSPLEITETRGKASEAGWQSAGGNVHTKQITFAQDGTYSFMFSSTDKAGNSSTADPVADFVIDCTEPKISVYYTGGTAKNEMYYKAARTATIEIDEMSFDPKGVEYTAQSVEEAAALPALGTFSSSGDTNTATISFDKDGKYGYVINCTDLAGNSCAAYTSDVFIIDTKAPEVTFSGVENYSANNGVVAPVVTYSDKYMDMKATTVKMTGSNNGLITLGSTTAEIENGFVVSYSDFAHNKSVDDLYTFEATVVDLAGNETKGELVFSVNRFGSVFVLGDATKALNEKYYTNQAQDIVITEINVDALTYRDVSINRDGDITNLSKDKDYSVAKQGSDTSWKTYTYTISKDNFKKDGVYSVTVYTEDRATNVQDNKSRDAEVNFAIDSTKPSIVTSGIENGLEKYETESYDFNLDVTDNMMLKSLVVYDNKEAIATYDQEQLLNNTDTKVITLKSSDRAKRTITVEAEDLAGNKETIVYSNVVVTNALPEVLGVTKPSGEGNEPGEPGDGTIPRPAGAVIWVIIGLGAVAMAGGAGVVLYKKKK